MFRCSIVTVCRRTEGNLCFLHSEFLSWTVSRNVCLLCENVCRFWLLFVPRNCSREFSLFPSLFRYQKFVNLLWTCSKLYKTSYLMFDHIYHGKIERDELFLYIYRFWGDEQGEKLSSSRRVDGRRKMRASDKINFSSARYRRRSWISLSLSKLDSMSK
jgi:hypothetical protein